MNNHFEARPRRVKAEGRLVRINAGAVNGVDNSRAGTTVSAVHEELKSKWGEHSYAAASFHLMKTRFIEAVKNTNIAYLIRHGDKWNEVVFVHATNSRTVPIRKVTYDSDSAWTIHLGHPGGILRAALAEAWFKMK